MSQTDQERYERLYQEVGRLTRALHDSIRDFHMGISLNASAEMQHELSEMADARSRLNYVISMTEDAANKTMDMVDEAAPVIHRFVGMSQELKSDWHAYQAQASLTADEPTQALLGRVSQFIDTVADEGGGVDKHLTEILMAQGYQDLSGQVIKRVIALVSDVEKSLVNLVKLASNVEQVAGIESPAQILAAARKEDDQSRIRAEGPQMKGAAASGVVSNQDDVDDLLSSLGF